MRTPLLLVIAFFFALNAFGQNIVLHYIKFVHVGEQIMPVHTLNISYGGGYVPRDSTELLNDTLHSISVVTDEASYNTLESYIANTNTKLGRHPGHLDFGTFKVIEDGKRFYLPDADVTDYFKKMVKYLKRKNANPQLTKAIVDNYPWIFNP